MGDAKIGQHATSVEAAQDVFRLHVAMHDALAVRVAEGAGDVAYHAQREARIVPAFYQVGHRPAGFVAHGHVRAAVVHADVVDGDDVGVVKLRGEPGLAKEAFGGDGILG